MNARLALTPLASGLAAMLAALLALVLVWTTVLMADWARRRADARERGFASPSTDEP